MSRYSIIWETLKREHECKITSPASLHARVIKGVIRTKDEDIAFKLEASQKAKKYRLSYKKVGIIIQFKLHEYDHIGAI